MTARLAVLGLVVLTGCSSGTAAHVRAGASPYAAQPSTLTADPCTLLTIPEVETAIGPGAVRGGLGRDAAGSCTFSVGGDVGAGVVHVTDEDPLTCAALHRALAAGSNASRVSVAEGGLVSSSGAIEVAVHGGCLKVAASAHGRALTPDALVALATAAVAHLT